MKTSRSMNRLALAVLGTMLGATTVTPAGEPSAEPPRTSTAAPTDPAATTPAAASSGRVATPLSQEEFLARRAQDPDLLVLDVRAPAEFAAGHVPGAQNVSHDELPTRLAELSKHRDKPVVLYCRSGRRTAIAAQVLRDAGFSQLLHLEGDWLAWEEAKQPIEK